MGENGEKKESNDGVFSSEELNSIKKSLISELMKIDDDITTNAISLVQYALSLIRSQSYNEGIGILRQAIELYSQVGRIEEINAIKQKIEEISALKEKFVRKIEVKEISGKNLLNIAENFIKKAKELIKLNDFDNAIENYEKAIKFFEEMKDNSKIEKVYKLIEQCYDLKSDLLKKTKKEDYKLEGDEFHNTITAMVNNAESLSFKYDQEKKKAIKEKKFLQLESPYPRIIQIYENIKNMFFKKGWVNQGKIYNKQIKIYQNKLLKDKKLREIEAQKAKNVKQYEQFFKVRKEVIESQNDIAKLKIGEERYQKQIEKENFQERIAKMVDEAERLSFNYEQEKKRAIKEKSFLTLESKYPEIIEIYQNIRNMLVEKGWNEQSKLYLNQIRIIKEKMNKEERLRKIEAQKELKQKQFKGFVKIKDVNTYLKIDYNKATEDKEKFEKAINNVDFESQISNMVERAVNLARKYEFAVRKGDHEVSCPYPEIIQIYAKIRHILLDKGLKEEADIYTKQIQLYQKKLDSIQS